MSNNWGAWMPLYHGVDWLSMTVPFAAVPYPPDLGRYPTVNLVRVRLDDPHVTTYSTPASGLNPDGVQLRRFLQTTFEQPGQAALQGIVGINANFFDIEDASRRNTIYGLAASNLETVPSEPPPDDEGYYPLLITKSNRAVIGTENQSRQADTWTAVSGNKLLLQGGRPAVSPPQADTAHPVIAARTAVGVSNDPDRLYLITVDGLETNNFSAPYYGASYFDVAMLLMLAGATAAVNLDGGGSTTMGRFDNHGFVAMKVPYGDDVHANVERAVGNCFAVIARA